MDPFDPTDAADESDGSGRTNLEVFQAGGHPRALLGATRYLAEGASGGFFSTHLGLANPGVDAVAAVLRFVRPDGTHVAEAFGLPPMSSRRVAIALIGRQHKAGSQTRAPRRRPTARCPACSEAAACRLVGD